MKDIGIYIHIPFCKKKCNYCDFISFENKEKYEEEYFKCLILEIENSKKNYDISDFLVNTIYIGGGTPSFVNSKFIVEVLDCIRNNFKLSENCEITIEVNPGTVNYDKVLEYKNAGINRISIGCQAVQNQCLKMLGRIHTYDDFLESYKIIKNVGFDNINVDLMIGLPNQKLEDVEKSVNEIVKLEPKHISVYSLIVEEGTVIEKMIENNELKLPDEKLERKMYKNVKKILNNHGFIHYEISNFAKKGFESKHNLDCWNQKEYLGFGLASHSYYDSKRFSNTDELEKYISNIKNDKINENVIVHEVQNIQDKKKEFMLLGLRKIDGVSISDFEHKFDLNPLFYFRFEISKLVDEELIEVDLDSIKLTKKGLDLANIVWEEFV